MGRMVGDQAGLLETPHHELLHAVFVQRLPGAGGLLDEVKRLRTNPVHPATGFQVHFQLGGGPLRLKLLDQLGRADHFHAEAAHQFNRAGIHVGHIGDGAARRVLHRHLFRILEQLLQPGLLLLPAGVRNFGAGQVTVVTPTATATSRRQSSSVVVRFIVVCLRVPSCP
jgi:hypothetical protein